MIGSSLLIIELQGKGVAFRSCLLLFTAGTMFRSSIMSRYYSPHCLLLSGICATFQDGISPLPELRGSSPKLVLQGANALCGQGKPKLADGTVSLIQVWYVKDGFADLIDLIVCDPSIKQVLTNYSGKTGYNVTTAPYNAGYVDFMPHRDQVKSRSGPPRTSFLDDIIFYLHNHPNALDLADPGSPKTFAEKIVASHYLKLAEFTQTVIERVQFNLSRRQDLTSVAIAAVEEQWSDVQALARRVGEYKDDIEAIMLQLRIPFENSNLKHTPSWEDSAPDYQYLYLRFKEIGQRVNGLNSSVAALASLTNNRQAAKAQELAQEATERSIREAKCVKVLTILGVVFIPLAYVASLLNMSDPYGPGGRLFWVYFLVAFPLTGLTVLGYYALEVGYTGPGVQWSFRTAVATVKKNLDKNEEV